MPVMDGLEATRRIRRLPGLAQVPIIATSATMTGELRMKSLAAGAGAFIPKPIEREALLEAIRGLLGLTWRYGEARSTVY